MVRYAHLLRGLHLMGSESVCAEINFEASEMYTEADGGVTGISLQRKPPEFCVSACVQYGVIIL